MNGWWVRVARYPGADGGLPPGSPGATLSLVVLHGCHDLASTAENRFQALFAEHDHRRADHTPGFADHFREHGHAAPPARHVRATVPHQRAQLHR